MGYERHAPTAQTTKRPRWRSCQTLATLADVVRSSLSSLTSALSWDKKEKAGATPIAKLRNKPHVSRQNTPTWSLQSVPENQEVSETYTEGLRMVYPLSYIMSHYELAGSEDSDTVADD